MRTNALFSFRAATMVNVMRSAAATLKMYLARRLADVTLIVLVSDKVADVRDRVRPAGPRPVSAGGTTENATRIYVVLVARTKH